VSSLFSPADKASRTPCKRIPSSSSLLLLLLLPLLLLLLSLKIPPVSQSTCKTLATYNARINPPITSSLPPFFPSSLPPRWEEAREGKGKGREKKVWSTAAATKKHHTF